MVISLLTTRVKQPNMYDYKKLARCVRYIRDTMEIPLTSKENKYSVMRWWIDAVNGLYP